MRIILLYILLVAFGCQQTTVNGQQTPFLESENLKNSESEKGCEQRTMSNETFLETENLKTSKSEKVQKDSQVFNFSVSQIQKDSQVFSFSVSQILYFENQIHIADSLYKNYLPQYNFEEVKAAVMFFDSCEQRAMSNEPFSETEKSVNISEICGNEKTNHKLVQKKSEKSSEPRAMSHEQRFRKAQSSQHEAQSLKKTVDCCPLTVDIEYQRARAHYYHAVGLTERDDIVGACEHYLCALEIMETKTENLKTSKSGKGSEQRAMSHEQKFRNAHSSKLEVQSPDYEKIRFVALINLRLAELLNDNQFCNLSINKSKEALRYAELTSDTLLCAVLLKNIGHSYHFLNNRDSALFYYENSLKISSNKDNSLDIYKCIAKILYEKGDKDVAYDMVRENIPESKCNEVKCAYYVTLGMMLYEDMEYDSATIYLNKAINDTESADIMITAARCLSLISDSVKNLEQKNHYDNLIIELLTQKNNASVRKGEIQALFEKYDSHEYEMKNTFDNIFYLVFILFLLIVLFSIKYFTYKNKNKNLQSELSDFMLKCNEQEVTISEKDRVIVEFEHQLNKKYKDFDNFKNCSICRKIFSDIDYLRKNGFKVNNLSPLTEDELELLIDEANVYMDGYVRDIIDEYPQLKKDDVYCICLSLLNISEPTMAVLLGKSYNSIWKRMKKVRKIIEKRHRYLSSESEQQIREEIPDRRDPYSE